MIRTMFAGAALFLVPLSSVMAEKNVTIQPLAGSLGDAVASVTFDEPLAKPISAVKGDWKVVDGVLMGKELASDEHAAVLNYQLENTDSVVRFSFKFDDNTNGAQFSMNHAKGHLFRVIVTKAGVSVNLDKDKSDPTSKAKKLGSANVPFKTGQWYTMQIEMRGDRVVVQTDNDTMVDVSDAKLKTTKPSYRWVMKGNSLAIDDLIIWK
ncbi:hypothetical protein Poly51_48200 [Rubripirellula tenax]|uniref:3-keto-alpha-glucoside-1,2-lyase/3-keto-2-hydroxy-glucal hydratase domain-containing protein n=1 Tax=Rubripirellula tenax TaxID=2528015 RepID=A0A5C6EMX9_9BACT|nr:family 16 glycoside hydrolase [Rubripirellula tenax]TWU48916.1 hypothetical protein Poly51_48200 [Rubripirellula tenax]